VAPITVLIGRNNSGKSALIQPLLLLKQALAIARPELALNLSGEFISARSIRDLTHGWPGQAPSVLGPSLAIEWETVVDIPATQKLWVNSQISTVAERAGLPWLLARGKQPLTIRMDVAFRELEGTTTVSDLCFTVLRPTPAATAEFRRSSSGGFAMTWNGERAADEADIKLDHFLPYIDISHIQLQRNDSRRAYLNGWLTCFASAIEDLRALLGDMQYLSSARDAPKERNEPVSAPPNDVGANGALAADLFKSRGGDLVHYLPPLILTEGSVTISDAVRERPLRAAVNDVLTELGVTGNFSVEDADVLGYRLLFGRASLPHVGRGLTYLLPVVEVGLLGDPCRFTAIGDQLPIDQYSMHAGRALLIALEEPESHLHPKVQSRLAQWLVALARCQRQFIIESHSDHFVRRLRGLVARAGAGTTLESWLLESVRIYAVTQSDGVSELTPMKLTPTGGLEDWPEDFMDEASQEDSAIYYSGLTKEARDEDLPKFVHDEGGPEPEVDT
jgi:predicted ATPase